MKALRRRGDGRAAAATNQHLVPDDTCQASWGSDVVARAHSRPSGSELMNEEVRPPPTEARSRGRQLADARG